MELLQSTVALLQAPGVAPWCPQGSGGPMLAVGTPGGVTYPLEPKLAEVRAVTVWRGCERTDVEIERWDLNHVEPPQSDPQITGII